MGFIIGTDTGGTFTDVVAIDDEGVITSGKALTTPSDLTVGMLNALGTLAENLKLSRKEMLAQTRLLIFGSTTATNTVLVGSGVKTGILTTAGFEDVIYIGRGVSTWIGVSPEDLKHAFKRRRPEPLVPKEYTRGILERVDSQGQVVYPMDAAQVKKAVAELLEKGIEACAVCFLWSPKNTTHETEASRIVKEMGKDIYISTSNEVGQVLGEYERWITTVIDAYVAPPIIKFQRSFQKQVAAEGFKGDLLVMEGSGGAKPLDDVTPVGTVQSGPAGGVLGCKLFGDVMGIPNIIGTDVGGTSFDVSVVADGAWHYSREPAIGRFGLSVPLIDVVSIGAGGGSIAWIDEGKVMRVGPQSAGGYPGPACYGNGGEEPTTTDACLVLGYLNPDYFLGGRQTLSREKAVKAIQKVSEPLGLSVTECAAGMCSILTAHMADLLRSGVVKRGYDPRDFSLLAYGAAGPMFAAMYGSEIGVKEVIVPFVAGAFSAFGIAGSNVLYRQTKPGFYPMPVDIDIFNSCFQEVENKVIGRLEKSGFARVNQLIRYEVEMRYGGQVHTLRLPIDRKTYRAADLNEICNQFDATYDQLYGKGAGYKEAGRFVEAFTVEGVGVVPKFTIKRMSQVGPDSRQALKGKRQLVFSQDAKSATGAIYDYRRLLPGNVLDGPAIIEAPYTTAVIPPKMRGTVDEFLNIRIRSV